jgi:hypothetical protein
MKRRSRPEKEGINSPQIRLCEQLNVHHALHSVGVAIVVSGIYRYL